MKRTVTRTSSLLVMALTLNLSLFSQKAADIVNESNEITWLGIDFSLGKFVGTAYQFKDAGEITSNEFWDKYAPGLNQLFVDEAKKYDVADAVYRKSIKNAIEVTEKLNTAASKTEFFTTNSDEYKSLDEEKIKAHIKKYDFKGNTGIGLVFIVDGMSKSKEEAGAWVTYVDMKTKQVLHTSYISGKAGGFGFRNYWAKAFLNILKDTKDDYKKLKKA